MQRGHSATNGFRSESKPSQSQQLTQQRKRPSSAGPRHAVVHENPQDEAAFYTQRLNEIAAQHAKLERDYQQRVAANRRAIRQMHDESTHLRTIRAGSGDITAMELEQLEQRKFIAVRRLNRLAHQLEEAEREAKESENARRHSQRRQIEMKSECQREAITGNRSVALRIQKLEKRLDATMAEQQCIASLKKGYAEMLEQLHAEGLGGEARVFALEHDIDARHQDYTRLILMYKNATTDYQTAKEELRKFTENFQRTRRMKDKALAERRERVEKALRETQRLEQREVELQQEIEDEHNRIEEAEAELQAMRQRRQRSVSVMERLSMCQDTQQQQKPMDLFNSVNSLGGSPEDEERAHAYEESFRNMIRATGAESLDDLVAKYEAEYAARLQLQEQIREEELKLDRLKDDVRRLREEEEKQRHCGAGPPLVTPCLREEIVTCIEEAIRKRDEVMESSDKLQKQLAEVIRRVDVLADMLALYRPSVHISHTNSDNLVSNLKLIQQKIFSLADEAVPRGVAPLKMDSMLIILPSTNTRVKLPHPPNSSIPPLLPSPTTTTTTTAALTLQRRTSESINSYGIIPSSDVGELEASIYSSTSDSKEASRAGIITAGNVGVGVGSGEKAMTLLDTDEPLSRDQIKRLAAVVLRREARRRQREERRR